MGKKDRERFGQTGKVFRNGEIVDAPKVREVSDVERERMQRVGFKVLQAMGTGNQIKVLRDSLHQGRLKPDKLREALEDNAYKEMRKGADKLRKKGKPATVGALLEEYHKNKDFGELATEVGLDEAWFVALAEKEILSIGGV